YSDELLDDLVVSGTEAEITERLRGYIADGCGEILAHPLIEPDDRAGSIARAFSAVAAAHNALAGEGRAPRSDATRRPAKITLTPTLPRRGGGSVKRTRRGPSGTPSCS